MYKKTKKNNKLKLLTHILRAFVLLLCFSISTLVTGQVDSANAPFVQDTSLISGTDSARVTFSKDSLINAKPSKESSSIESTINYSAKDSIKVDVVKQKVHIYGDAHVDYGPDNKKMNLDAAYIEIDWSKNLLTARSMTDSNGNEYGKPHFSQGTEEYYANTIKYNFKTERGIITGVQTQQGEGFVHGDTVMKNKHNEMFIKEAKYTTCNLENPHFYIHSQKMKMVPDKLVVSGPFNIVLSDIPTPLGFIFGIFPMPKEKSSGIIMPSPRTQSKKGVGLTGGGYYWAVNDYIGTKLVGDYFSNGSWRAEFSTQYIKRYNYTGNFAFGLSNVYNGYDKETDSKVANNYMFRWNHSETAKKNSSFAANIQIQSPGYIQANSVNFNRILKNQFTSNIKYTKRFGKSPFSMGVNMSQNQDIKGKMNFRVPDVNLNMSRQQPFKRYRGFGKEYVKNFAFNYNGVFKNSFTNLKTASYGESLSGLTNVEGNSTFGDTIGFSFDNIPRLLFENGKFGYQHSTTIQNNFKALKGRFTVNPNMSYEETYYSKVLDYNWRGDDSQFPTDSVQVNTIDGFRRLVNYSLGVNLNTVLYSSLAIRGKHIPKIRNMIRPQIGYRYRPDFSDPRYNYYQTVQTDSLGTKKQFSRYNNFVFTTPGSGKQNLLTWSVSNAIEMKMPSKGDSAAPSKPIRLLNLNLSSNYNFSADSLRAAPVSVSANTKIGGFDINYSSTHDFYKLDSLGARTNTLYATGLEWYRPLRTNRANLTIGTSFNPKARKKKAITKEDGELNPTQQAELDYINANPEEYIDFEIPWNLRVNYNLAWNQPTRVAPTITQTMKGSGNLSLSKKWKVTFSSTYNIQEKNFAATNIGIVRDLHCWEMTFDWIPTGRYQSVSFTIRAKSSLLQDLKYTHAPQHALY